MRLSTKDFDAFQRATLALHACRDIAAFARALPGILLKLIPADHFFLCVLALSPQMDAPRLVDLTEIGVKAREEMVRYLEGHLFEHPFPKYFAQTGDPVPLKMSDFHTVHKFRTTELYQRIYRILGIEWQMGFPAKFGPGTVGGISFGNKGKDFTERDRLMLDLLRPHIELARRNAILWTQRQVFCHKSTYVWKLTQREAEIAGWVAAGKTNPEIAMILDMNVRTVEKHMEKILEKLRVENRTAAAVVIAAEEKRGTDPKGALPKSKQAFGV